MTLPQKLTLHKHPNQYYYSNNIELFIISNFRRTLYPEYEQ